MSKDLKDYGQNLEATSSECYMERKKSLQTSLF